MAMTAEQTVLRIQAELSGQTWSVDTCDAIAGILREAGYVVADVDDEEEDDHDDAAHTCAVLHTICQYCGQDIEGPYPGNDWRDRGNNRACPYPAEGQTHAPVGEAPSLCPDCGDRLTDDVEADGRPCYCPTCDREVG